MEDSFIARNEEIKRYLYCEMDKNEQASIEEKMFEDDSYFSDVESLENELIDKYARKELTGEEKIRFERSLAKVEDRRAKIANAMALQAYIVENEQLIAPFISEANEEGEQSFGAKIREFFSFQGFSRQFALGSLAILLALAVGFFAFNNYRANQEIARLKEEKGALVAQEKRLLDLQNELQTQENELEIRLEKITQQEAESAQAREDKIKLVNEMNELQRKKERISEELRQSLESQRNLPKAQEQKSKPTFAAEVFSIFKGGSEVRIITLKPTDTEVRVTFPTLFEDYIVELNGKNIKSRKIKGKVYLTIPRKKLNLTGENTITYMDSARNPPIFTLKMLQ